MLRQVTVENGEVRGIPAADPRITVFKGIPFAAPPVGDLRWRAPRPANNWKGIYKADTFSPIPMQETPGAKKNIYAKEWHVDQNVPMSEDCLYLNVWTPAKQSDEKLPVMIWIFGGGLQCGYSSEMEFDGERIARRGVILVSFNYRVNVFGFFAHPELTAEDPDGLLANFGLYDQKAAFEWVQRNISAFGGDPDNVTIFGQSAGGGSVIMHTASPLMKGLFHRAIIHSGGGMLPPSNKNPSLAEAEQTGIDFLKYLGVGSISEARMLDAGIIRDKMLSYASRYEWSSITDGQYLTDIPTKVILRNEHNKIPCMIGDTGAEFPVKPAAKSIEEFEGYARKEYGESASEYLRLCKSNSGNLQEMLKKGTFNNFQLGNILWCEKYVRFGGGDVYYYRFDPEIPGDNAGSFHSSELWFTFETLAKSWRPFKGKHYDLARQMCNYWTNYAKSGNPNGLDADGSPMPEWTPFTPDSPFPMHFGDKPAMDHSRDDMMQFLLKYYNDHLEECLYVNFDFAKLMQQ